MKNGGGGAAGWQSPIVDSVNKRGYRQGMPKPATKTRQVNPQDMIRASGLARRYGVSRAAVSNWAKRYADFPKPVAPGVFLLPEVIAWRASRGWAEPE